MKKLLIPFIILILSVYLIGCGDDKGSNPTTPTTKPPRLIVDTTVTAPTMSGVDEAVWNMVDSAKVVIGRKVNKSWYDGSIGDTVIMKAIKKADTLYIRAHWRDGSVKLWGNYIRKADTAHGNMDWEHVVTEGDNKFFILFDGQDNGTEKANCATMCHEASNTMITSGGGHVDVWNWKSTTSFPGKLADDEWWGSAGRYQDYIAVNTYMYSTNWDDLQIAPLVMHRDTLDFQGTFLFTIDTVDMDKFLAWPVGFKMPGYIIDSTLYKSPTLSNSSRWDVMTVAEFDSTAAPYTWTVVFRRALNTHTDDVNLTDLDSVQVTIAAAHNHTSAYEPEHSGSAPFYIILKP